MSKFTSVDYVGIVARMQLWIINVPKRKIDDHQSFFLLYTVRYVLSLERQCCQKASLDLIKHKISQFGLIRTAVPAFLYLP